MASTRDVQTSSKPDEEEVMMKGSVSDPAGKSVSMKRVVIIIVALVLLLTVGIILGVVFGTGETSFSKGFVVIPEGDIVFSPNDNASYAKYVSQQNEALRLYDGEEREDRVLCKDERPEDKMCKFPITWLESCSDKYDFGFKESKPCVLLTFKNDDSYNPAPFDSIEELPSDMPLELKSAIEEDYESNENEMEKQTWVHCNGTSNYFPHQGFMTHFFPTQNREGYLAPVIAVPIDLRDKDEVYMECSLWSNSGTGMPDFKQSFRIRKEIRNKK